MFLKSGEKGGEYELVFFRRLDDEFNKVIKFYKKKVEEVMVEADELSKQMNALIALRIKVDNPVVGGADMVNLAANGLSSNSSSVAHPTNGGKQSKENQGSAELRKSSLLQFFSFLKKILI